MKTLIHLTLAAGWLWAALTGNEAHGQTNLARAGRFYRGTGTNTTYQSFVLPLDFQKGVALDNLNGNATNLFPAAGTNYVFGATRYHYDATKPGSSTNVALRIPYNNPIAAFGGRVGGSPLYYNQDYHFGAYAGFTAPYSTSALYIDVYRASDGQLVAAVPVEIPALADTNAWRAFLTNGYTTTVTAYGLTTTLRFDDPDPIWGISYGAGCYHLTHQATQTGTNYFYGIILAGYTDGSWMTTDAAAAGAWSRLYTVEFEPRPLWRAVMLDQPQFTGTLAPSFYQGASLPELLTNAPPVTNAVSLAPSSCTNLDASPELRQHPTLDQFVSDMGRDPLALANYVQNEISLADAIAYNDNGGISDVSINLGGVNRSALGTFLEKQGSPAEQCALLVYLLRQAGVPAAYVFAPENGLKMLDTQLSKLLRMQIHGAINNGSGANGQPYTTNSLIAVNYPWVAAYIGTNWVHLFPWLKDTEIVEGPNLYNYLPAAYKTSYQWVRDYLYGNTNLLSLSSDDDTPQTLFPLFVKQILATNSPGISLDDIGVRVVDRRHLYSRWTDFPRPPVVTNTSIAIESLGSPAMTNVYSRLTNIFDTASVTVSSVTNPATKLATGTLRMVDLHNRKFLIRHEKISSTSHRMILTLEPYRPGTSGVGPFTNDAWVVKQQSVTNTLGSTDDALTVQIVFNRHRSLPAGFVAPDHSVPYLGLSEYTSITNNRPLRKGDLAAICLNVGAVSLQMLEPHAEELWNMEATLRANPAATNTLSADVYQGTVAYLMGMAYYEKVGRFDALNQHLHKVQVESQLGCGLASIRAARTNNALPGGNIDLVQPSVDMFFQEVVIAGNTTIHLDSGDDGNVPNDDYFHLSVADASAQEHSIINHYFQQAGAVSTLKLLQLAQAKSATNGQPGVLALDCFNYPSEGNKNYPTAGTTKLKDQSPTIWAAITNAFASSATAYENYAQVFITPGPVTNQTASFKGMGAFILQPSGAAALISEQNGGYGANNSSGSLDLGNAGNISLGVDSDYNYSVSLTPPSSANRTLAPDAYANYDAGAVANNAGYYTYSPFQATWTSGSMGALGLASQGSQSLDFSQCVQAAAGNSGFLSWLGDALSQAGSHIADPVHSVTGEFYIGANDLTLPGPMPLTLSRNYSSLNLADNQFGYGWKLNYMPYLSVSQGGTNIYAADMDGAVLAYVRTATNANVWLPTPAANPQLDNNTTAGVGGLVNRLRDRLVQTATTNYTLYGADGSVRAFQVMSFNSGSLNQTRPYLQQWTDNRGNYYTFAYGTNTAQPDFGQVRRIQCSNGNYLGFYFDVYGHIIEAYSGDGRRLLYEYDQFGDLVTVTLPDESTREYGYLHGTQAVTNGTVVTQQPYSTHLIVEEDKPDGRALVNAYDSQRRVTNQLSTAGADLTPVRTASFVYANNFNLTNSYTNTISGYTLVIDGNNHTNRYDYTNGLITQITDPLGQTIQQTWYADNAAPPGYPRSVSLRKDKRGLTTQFFYDSNGNVTNSIVTGDLTGDGIPTQTATNRAVYNANCLPLQTTDPAGNGTVFVYDSTFSFLPQQIIRYAGATPVSTNFTLYGSVTNTTVQGGSTQTNLARGLAVRQIRAYGSPDAATVDTAYDGHGFPTQTVRYTGTSDPAVTNSFFYNERGQRVDQLDALGALTHFEYDAMDRPTEQWYVDETGALLSWNFDYYNDNGEVTWIDGPAYNPEDYVWFDYDGAGRLSTEIHWRAEANPNGSGVQAPAGYNLYAQTFYTHDVLGNLAYSVNPRGVITTNTWDKLNRLASRSTIETNGTVLTTESFGYEPGGLERFHTNVLGGFTDTEYTTAGQPKYRSNPDGSTNGWRYYLDGRLHREIQRNGAYWETTYADALRKTTRIFYSGASVPLATNVTVLDRRGNVAQRVDAAFNVFTNLFDGLDRLKVAAGPATATVSRNCGMNPNCSVFVTNILQQAATRVYDAANRVLTVSNALGEKTVTTSDMLGRVLSRQTFAAGAPTPLRVTTSSYSADHHSVTVTEGSGAGAVVSTTFTDNDGHRLLTVGYPSTGVREYTLNQYDLAGNLIHEEHDSSGGPTVWTKADYAFDGLNRMIQKSDRDGAVTAFAYDAANNPTSRLMPGGLQWTATYNNAGQELQDWLTGTNGAGTMTNSLAYYPGGSAAVGLLETKTDGRGVSATYTYDDWLRLTNIVRSMGSPYGYLTTTWAYDVRGLATNITEMNAGDDEGPDAKVVSQTFDGYGQMALESITLNGALISRAGQGWDVAGRRTLLALNSQLSTLNYFYGWRADGLLGSVGASAGGGSYGYSTAGLLDTRMVGNRATTVTSRDGIGRPLAISTTVNTQQKLSETLSWTGDGLLGTHVLAREDFTDERDYTYASLSRRLIEERVNLGAATRWTNDFVYDGGAGAGLGLLTFAGQQTAGSAAWTGGSSPLGRISTETNTVSRQSAYGRFNGQATVSATLDGRPLPVSFNTTTVYAWTNRWSTTMELTPGAHQLAVSALHPSGLFTTNASVWFTNNLGGESDQIYRDGAGNITERVWSTPSGARSRTQLLTWDAKRRLCQVTDYDSQQNGFMWFAEYDGLDRLLCTKWYALTNGSVAIYGIIAQTNAFVYDPQGQFLDLGVYVGPSGRDSMPGQMTWKLCGPDLNGRYGGLNGAGGLEATATGAGYFAPTINDARGNVLGACDPEHGSVTWNASRPTGYGAVPGYRPLPLGHGGSYAQSAAWRGKWADVTGYIWRGRRFYDPIAGMWLSPDPQWNAQDPSYWSYAGDDPINHDDPNGECLEATGNLINNGGAAGYGLRQLGGYLDSYNNSSSGGGYFTGLSGSIVNELAGASAPSSYVNGLQGFGNNVSTIYNDGGILPASSYAISGWNVGKIYSGLANVDLVTGEQVGDWYARGTQIASGTASTAGITAGGLGLYNWATAAPATAAPASVPPVIAPVDNAASQLFYHYTTADESLFANGLREGSSVTDKLYTDPFQASQELGIPVPNKVIPIQNTGQFIPAKPTVVQGSNRYLGGGNDFNNPQPVPPSQLLPAQPIE